MNNPNDSLKTAKFLSALLMAIADEKTIKNIMILNTCQQIVERIADCYLPMSDPYNTENLPDEVMDKTLEYLQGVDAELKVFAATQIPPQVVEK